MKHTFTSKEIAHVWRNSSKAFGYGKAGNMSFNSDGFYSYGTIIARFITNEQGQRAIILNVTSYSNSTAKHQSYVRRALHDYDMIFRQGDMSMGSGLMYIKNGSGLVSYAINQAAECEAKGDRARTHKIFHYEAAQKWHLDAAKICAFFGLETYSYDFKALEEKIELARPLEEQRAAVLESQRLQRIANYAKTNEEKIAEWLNGKNISLPYNCPTLLRLKGDVIETSRGARIPAKQAAQLWGFFNRHRNYIGYGWNRATMSHPIMCGEYQLQSVNIEKVVIGCHTFLWEELDRFAIVLGLK